VGGRRFARFADRLGSIEIFVRGETLRVIGGLLMVSGWAIAVAALALLSGLGARFGFVAAGLGVEVLGLGVLAQFYRGAQMLESRQDEGRV